MKNIIVVHEDCEKFKANPPLTPQGIKRAEKISNALLPKLNIQEFKRSDWIVGSGTGTRHRQMRRIIFGSRVDGFESEVLGTPETIYKQVIFANGTTQFLKNYLNSFRFAKLYCQVPSLIRRKIIETQQEGRNLLLVTGRMPLYSLGKRHVKLGTVYRIKISRFQKKLKIRRLHINF